ncbi:hypothetical protein PAMP_005667 [Pampus punctatissimus]
MRGQKAREQCVFTGRLEEIGSMTSGGNEVPGAVAVQQQFARRDGKREELQGKRGLMRIFVIQIPRMPCSDEDQKTNHRLVAAVITVGCFVAPPALNNNRDSSASTWLLIGQNWILKPICCYETP